MRASEAQERALREAGPSDVGIHQATHHWRRQILAVLSSTARPDPWPLFASSSEAIDRAGPPLRVCGNGTLHQRGSAADGSDPAWEPISPKHQVRIPSVAGQPVSSGPVLAPLNDATGQRVTAATPNSP